MIDKSPDAYRTISEVADDLDLPQHVLRFWETKFSQIKPLKRGGGRRYYRPDDVELLKSIRHLLYNQGYTIKGVQRILKEQGPKAVQAFLHAGPPDAGDDDEADVDTGLERHSAHPHEAEPQQSVAPQIANAELPQPVVAQPATPPLPDALRQAMPDLPQSTLVQRPQISFTRGGLRPVVTAQDGWAEGPVVVPKPKPQPAPRTEDQQPTLFHEEPDKSEPARTSPQLTSAQPMRYGLSDAQRRALQATLFELTECRRTIQLLTQADR